MYKNKQKLCIAIVIVIMFIGLNSNCFAIAEQERYYNKEQGYSIKVPTESSKSENLDNKGSVAFINSHGTIIISNKKKFGDNTWNLDDILKLYISHAPKRGVSVYNHGKTTIDNNEAIWLEDYMSKQDKKIYTLIYFLEKNKTFYIVECGIVDEIKYSKYKSEYEKIVKTFRFE